MISENPTDHRESYSIELGLWTGILGPPIAWLIHFQIIYALVPRVCMTHSHAAMHLTTLVFLAATVACGLIAWKLLKPAPSEPGTIEPIEGISARPRFMAQIGIMSSVMFSLIFIAQWIASLMIDPCWF
jgi:hypothetical protein